MLHGQATCVACVAGEIPGGILDISLGVQVRRGPSYPDPV